MPLMRSQARFICATAGRRGGKTATAARKFLSRIMEDYAKAKASGRKYEPGAARPGTPQWRDRRAYLHYWCVAETNDLLDEVKRALLEAIPSELLDSVDNVQQRWWLRGSLLIEFKSGKDPRRLVGSGLNGIWIEEASRLRADAWPGFMRPLLSDKQGWAIVTGTPLGDDWVYEAFERPAELGTEGYEVHRWRTIDNIMCPGLREEVAMAKATLPDEYFRREYEADRNAFVGQIYKEYDPRTMLIDELPPGVQFTRKVGGVDWGFSAPGCELVAGITAPKPVAHGLALPFVYFLDEVYDNQELVEDFWVPEGLKLQAKWGFNDWVADPAEPDNLLRFTQSGMRVTGHKNYGSGKFDEHERSIRAGIRLMKILFKNRRVFVLKACKNLDSELRSYKWDTSSDGRMVEREAPGQKQHAATAARYIVSACIKPPVMRPLLQAA